MREKLREARASVVVTVLAVIGAIVVVAFILGTCALGDGK